MLEELGLIARQQGIGTVVTARDSSESYVQMVRSPAQLMQYPPDTRLSVAVVRRRGREPCAGAPARLRHRRALVPDPGHASPEARTAPRSAGPTSTCCRSTPRSSDDRAPSAADLRADRAALRRARRDRPASTCSPVRRGDRAAALGVEAGTPSLNVVRRYTGRKGRRVFEVSVSEHPAEPLHVLSGAAARLAQPARAGRHADSADNGDTQFWRTSSEPRRRGCAASCSRPATIHARSRKCSARVPMR